MIKTYNQMLMFPTFEERLEYLYIGGGIGDETFGNRRYLNQIFYKSDEWIKTRDLIIVRDMGRELAMEGCELNGSIIVHHINPITYEDILNRHPKLFDPNNLVLVSLQTHNYIHYGTAIDNTYTPRTPNDTCPWKK